MVTTYGFSDLFCMWSASHFSGPDDDCRIEQAALLQILNQRRNSLVGIQRVRRVILLQVSVLIPRRVVLVVERAGHFDEANPGFHQAAGSEALQAIRLLELVGVVHSVHMPRRFLFVAHVS